MVRGGGGELRAVKGGGAGEQMVVKGGAVSRGWLRGVSHLIPLTQSAG